MGDTQPRFSPFPHFQQNWGYFEAAIMSPFIAKGLCLTSRQPAVWYMHMSSSLSALNKAQEASCGPSWHWHLSQLPNLKCVQDPQEESKASLITVLVGLVDSLARAACPFLIHGWAIDTSKLPCRLVQGLSHPLKNKTSCSSIENEAKIGERQNLGTFGALLLSQEMACWHAESCMVMVLYLTVKGLLAAPSPSCPFWDQIQSVQPFCTSRR